MLSSILDIIDHMYNAGLNLKQIISLAYLIRLAYFSMRAKSFWILSREQKERVHVHD